MSRTKIFGGLAVVAVMTAVFILKSKEFGFDTASDLLRMRAPTSRSVAGVSGHGQAIEQSSHSAPNAHSVSNHDQSAARAVSSSGAKSDEEKVIQFISAKAPGKWSVEAHEGRVVSVFGGKVKSNLVESDEKLLGFVSEMAASLGYDPASVAQIPELKKVTDHEIINEFKQTIENVDVYGAYFRAFRDADKKEANFFITEFKKYEQVDSTSNVDLSDVLTKLDDYYSRLGNNVEEKSCSEQKVYFVDETKTARLAYKCTVKATAQLPAVYEVIVSAANSDVLYQKRMTIFN